MPVYQVRNNHPRINLMVIPYQKKVVRFLTTFFSVIAESGNRILTLQSQKNGCLSSQDYQDFSVGEIFPIYSIKVL